MLVSALYQSESAIHTHISPYLLPLSSPSHPPYPTPLGGHKAPSWSPCAMQLLLLAIYFTFGSVYMSMPLSHFVPASPSPSPCPQVHSLCLRLYSCPAPRSFKITFFFFFRFHIYVLAYRICFSLSDLLHSEPQILYLRNGNNNSTYLPELQWELNEYSMFILISSTDGNINGNTYKPSFYANVS